MTTDHIERLAAFDAYVEELKAHDWHFDTSARINKKWAAEAGRLQQYGKDQHLAGNPYPMQAYWAFTEWAYQHNDEDTRDDIVRVIRTNLATQAVTQLINPTPETKP